ncbi:MAG: hypothetical protein ACI9YT_003049 [Halobacteriales archaeon]
MWTVTERRNRSDAEIPYGLTGALATTFDEKRGN